MMITPLRTTRVRRRAQARPSTHAPVGGDCTPASPPAAAALSSAEDIEAGDFEFAPSAPRHPPAVHHWGARTKGRSHKIQGYPLARARAARAARAAQCAPSTRSSRSARRGSSRWSADCWGSASAARPRAPFGVRLATPTLSAWPCRIRPRRRAGPCRPARSFERRARRGRCDREARSSQRHSPDETPRSPRSSARGLKVSSFDGCERPTGASVCCFSVRQGRCALAAPAHGTENSARAPPPRRAAPRVTARVFPARLRLRFLQRDAYRLEMQSSPRGTGWTHRARERVSRRAGRRTTRAGQSACHRDLGGSSACGVASAQTS